MVPDLNEIDTWQLAREPDVKGLRAGCAIPIERIQTPAYFAFGDTDQVVSPNQTVPLAQWIIDWVQNL
ncbi:hypothetical protein [Octadecabacter antarcticus]|uniref:hypothetical protein n=1 Tax=Octadecabacter antarcticus TaxID=1217908 RepID=UPI0001806950|nr:hypothetical protein [Octadecabacter antarcticus]